MSTTGDPGANIDQLR